MAGTQPGHMTTALLIGVSFYKTAPVGQITKIPSSPSRKNILLHF
jgi:hypothetical protein